ncbi:MAG: ABC transporter ATP-binding protein [Euzebyales bacterium]|jgi:fluoroquinolone transport system ATP-binding protein|nr:ABC transporter ATP-binding protein [Euzebyales bacterium]
MSAVLTVEELAVAYPGASRPAVSGMSFSVARGEAFGFLGPNGAGKSTTQRVLTLLLRGYSGHVEALGRPLTRWGSSYYERIGVGFELPAHFGKLTARENLAAFASLYSGATQDPLALLERLDLADVADKRVRDFSKGMAMRLNLARALLHRPDVLFLDEPTSGLDPAHAAQVREVIREQVERGCTVFLTTHDMHTADELCDRIAFVAGGRIARLDTPRALKLAFGHRTVTVEHRATGGLQRAEFPLDGLGEEPAFLKLMRTGTVETIHTREASLEDVFTAVTGTAL